MSAIKSAAEFRKSLEENIRTISKKTGEADNRLRLKVAFDRFLARIFNGQSPFFLKGGYSMELRIANARATKDMDLTCFKRGIKEPMSEWIWQELQMLARIDLNDYFVFQIGPPQQDMENAPYGGSRHSITIKINDRDFVKFHLDVGGDFLVDDVEEVPGTDWLKFCGIAPPLIPMISVEQQFAEKLHSYTLPRTQINTRSKDLIDLILLLKHKNRLPEAFQLALKRVFKARNTHSLPAILPDPPAVWEGPFSRMAVECGIVESMHDCFTKVSDFYHQMTQDGD